MNAIDDLELELKGLTHPEPDKPYDPLVLEGSMPKTDLTYIDIGELQAINSITKGIPGFYPSIKIQQEVDRYWASRSIESDMKLITEQWLSALKDDASGPLVNVENNFPEKVQAMGNKCQKKTRPQHSSEIAHVAGEIKNSDFITMESAKQIRLNKVYNKVKLNRQALAADVKEGQVNISIEADLPITKAFEADVTLNSIRDIKEDATRWLDMATLNENIKPQEAQEIKVMLSLWQKRAEERSFGMFLQNTARLEFAKQALEAYCPIPNMTKDNKAFLHRRLSYIERINQSHITQTPNIEIDALSHIKVKLDISDKLYHESAKEVLSTLRENTTEKGMSR